MKPLFAEEFKREAVKLVFQPGASKAGISRDLGVGIRVGASLLGRWCREASGESHVGGAIDKVSSQEYERTRQELAKVKTQRDIFKKALGSRPTSSEVWLHRQIVKYLGYPNDVSGNGCVAQRLLRLD
ncbi:transposase [Massilia sp. PWRC2]|uniref:transposase n=1 Tax=Massilia sp. PWRC2 TaxID=2804626 RepID=UPI003CF51073